MNYFKKIFSLTIIFILCASISSAQSIDDLRSKIAEKNDVIEGLEQEISKYQKEIDALGKEKNSLSNTIKSLDISKKKLEADIKVTENKIASRNIELKELSLQIGDKSERISDSRRVISRSLSDINQANSASAIEAILGRTSFSDLWRNADQLVILQSSMQNKIEDLQSLKTNLEENKKLTEKKRLELVSLTNDLKNQTKIIADTAKQKNDLLKETRNSESSYNSLLALRKAQKEEYEREVLAFESALKIAIDPSLLPSTGKGILQYPLDNIRVTQYFGNTAFSTANPQVYNGKGHTGIDFAASIGTPVKASLSGIVIGAGNTDVGKCRSFGKWIMIKHPNGLSTLYAHLSLINVVMDQQVYTGQVIGYSGNTGYSTGPHLHFGVYATEGLNITKNVNSAACSKVTIPYADLKAYLNPLSYLNK
jgi:murein DD-endopeptidase MepM/ murein hydrolase activator NlpD